MANFRVCRHLFIPFSGQPWLGDTFVGSGRPLATLALKKTQTPGSRRQGKGSLPPPRPGSDGKSRHSKGRKKAGQIKRTLSLQGGEKKARYITELSLQVTARDSARPLTQARQRDAGTAGTASVRPHAPGAHGRWSTGSGRRRGRDPVP